MTQSDKVKVKIGEHEIEVAREEAGKVQNAISALENIAELLENALGNIRTHLTEKSNGAQTTGHGDD